MSTAEQPTSAPTNPVAKARKSVTITLLEPLQRQGQTITTVQLLKPRVGELRGIALNELLTSKPEALVNLLPRITQPMITEKEIWAMDGDGLVQMAVEVVSFLSGTDSTLQE
ncbi:phage tail assembly protein [Comamonas odontotermitis]|uniref:phage tail assembly protein n=1 Tax=Comamonas odontotermitis TaxID=379895 RepID=UPI00366DE02E